MGWLFLLLAILLEVSGTTCLKLSAGFTKWLPSVLVLTFYGLSLLALGFCLKQLEVGAAYAIWAGLGTALIAMIGFIWFKEPVSAIKIVCLLLIVAGVVGLKAAGGQ
ncbi:MAG TPA: multidrug efflux SMR transporter [Gemmataceae bacterium]|jgi:small multidrug resistance pump|nr:multidrug efflux SMR transporter [Gemmataceae bacterium]